MPPVGHNCPSLNTSLRLHKKVTRHWMVCDGSPILRKPSDCLGLLATHKLLSQGDPSPREPRRVTYIKQITAIKVTRHCMALDGSLESYTSNHLSDLFTRKNLECQYIKSLGKPWKPRKPGAAWKHWNPQILEPRRTIFGPWNTLGILKTLNTLETLKTWETLDGHIRNLGSFG